MSTHYQEPVCLREKNMYPTIQTTDDLGVDFFTSPQQIDNIPAGELVLVRNRSDWGVRRVVEWQGSKVVKGDWSNDFEPDILVWGVVKKVNGRSSRRLSSASLGRLSQQIHQPRNSWVRRFYRTLLWLRVSLIRLMQTVSK